MHGSVGAAASALGCTPSAVPQQITKPERDQVRPAMVETVRVLEEGWAELPDGPV